VLVHHQLQRSDTNAWFRTHPVSQIRARRHRVRDWGGGRGENYLLKFVTRFIFSGLNVLVTEGSPTRDLAVTLTVTTGGLRLSNRGREEGWCALTGYRNYWTYLTLDTSGVKSVPEEGFMFRGLTWRL
jgi:hypothetical protein